MHADWADRRSYRRPTLSGNRLPVTVAIPRYFPRARHSNVLRRLLTLPLNPPPCLSRTCSLPLIFATLETQLYPLERSSVYCSPSDVRGITAHPPSNVGQLPRPRISRSPLHRGSRHNPPLSRAASQGSGWPSRRTPSNASWGSPPEGAR
jgi:hypothetical protein